MGPYNYETCELSISDTEYNKILTMSKLNNIKLTEFISLVRKIFDIPSYKEIKLKVENGNIL